ncbi:MAG: MMPL family transporter, partial [Rhodobacterales bacterium]|nr:MMPL family transporter [Rhodobacterales bacterium]
EPGLLDMDPLFDTMPDQLGDDWQRWRDHALSNRLLVPSLISLDGTTTAILVEAKYDTSDVSAIQPLVTAVEEVMEAYEGTHGLHLGLAGIPPVRAAFFTSFQEDTKLFVPVGAVFITISLFLIFRSFHGVLVPGLAATLPVLMVFGIMGWTGEPIGLLSQTYITLLPVIAIADAIHLVTRFHEELRAVTPAGTQPTHEMRWQAIEKSASKIGAACLITSVTTAVGFLSLSVAQMPILQHFGLYASLGIFLAYGGVLFLIPMLLMFTRGGPMAAPTEDGPSRTDRLLLACADFSLERPWIVLGATAIILVGSVWFGRNVVVDNNLSHTLAESHPVSQANYRADRELGGILGLEVDLQGQEDAFKQPEVLAALLMFESWALAQPEVRQATSPATWIAMLHQATTGQYTGVDSPEAAAQFYLLAEVDPAFTRMIDADYSRARMLLTLKDEGARAFDPTVQRIDAALQTHLADVPITGAVTGTPYVAYRGINGVTHDLRNSLILAFVIITIIIAVLFRDLRTGLLCLLPNAMPLVVGYGLMGVMGWLLDPTPAVIFTVALGIAVDDTLHLMIRTREEMERGIGLKPAVRNAVLHSGRAVLITSIILIGGFGVNALSSFSATRILGMLGGTVIVTALLCDLFLLPALLSLWGRDLGLKTAS